MEQIIKYFNKGKECPDTEADEIVVQEVEKGRLIDEKRYYKKVL
jgi:hypothetical protein